MSEDVWQPIRKLPSELEAEVTWHEGTWGVGQRSCCYSAEGLCSVEQSCLCNLIQCAFWVGPWPVLLLEPNPGVGLESSLVQGTRQQVTSIDTVWSYGPEWLPRIWVGGSVPHTRQPSLLPALDQLFATLFESLALPKQLNFSWFCLGFSEGLWNATEQTCLKVKSEKKTNSTSNWMPVPCNIHFLLITELWKTTFVS